MIEEIKKQKKNNRNRNKENLNFLKMPRSILNQIRKKIYHEKFIKFKLKIN